MDAVILIAATTAVASLGFLALLVVVFIGIRTEGSHLSPSGARHTRTETMARRILDLYVRRELEKTSVQHWVRR